MWQEAPSVLFNKLLTMVVKEPQVIFPETVYIKNEQAAKKKHQPLNEEPTYFNSKSIELIKDDWHVSKSLHQNKGKERGFIYIFFYYSLFSPPCQNNPKTQLRVNSSSFMLAQYTHKVRLVLAFTIKQLRADLIKDNAHTLKVTLKY